MIKYSFILPYYKRLEEFKITLASFIYHYGKRTDWNIYLIIDRESNDIQKLMEVISQSEMKNIIVIMSLLRKQVNPVIARNLASRMAEGNILIHSSPEVCHAENILVGLDDEYQHEENKYVVCSCISCELIAGAKDFKDVNFKPVQWYQHSELNNRCLHFCSAIRKQTYIDIGGFDEAYAEFQSYDDDDFIKTIRKHQIPISLRDDLKTIHIEHDRSHQNNPEMIAKGIKYFEEKWKIQP